MGRMQDRVAIITGGSSGIGAAAARIFISEGAKVVIGDINDSDGAPLADELGANCVYAHVDHTSRADNESAVALALSTFGRLDILYNNAGIGSGGRFEKVDDDELDRVISVNLVGPFRMTQAALPALKESAPSLDGGASIVFTSSLQGISARPNLTPYTAAKHGIIGLMKGLALELGAANVRVNAVCPVATDTPMIRGFMPDSWDEDRKNETLAKSGQTIPLGRVAQPKDIANAALFLASAEAGMITGAALPVDGGMSAGIQDHATKK
ncbi:MAG: SDR family NAD(P)-dependent oxidoreductase [Alphaproteobacteria bacterium]|jgi:NAD(P)-dependent dehydrogenase (short-subunit alcohol dehydrogenase family)